MDAGLTDRCTFVPADFLLPHAGFELRRIVPTGSPTGLAVIEAYRRP